MFVKNREVNISIYSTTCIVWYCRARSPVGVQSRHIFKLIVEAACHTHITWREE